MITSKLKVNLSGRLACEAQAEVAAVGKARRSRRHCKCEAISRPQQKSNGVEQPPETKQQFVSQMLDTVLAQAGH